MSGLRKGDRRRFVSLASQDGITETEHPNVNNSSSTSHTGDQDGPDTGVVSPSKHGPSPLDLNPVGEHGRLHRGLSARQVQMIAIAGE